MPRKARPASPPPADAADPEFALAREVAASLTSAPVDGIRLSTRSVESGLAHVGCFIHDVAFPSGGAAPVRFLEKRSRKRDEVTFAPALQARVFPSGLAVGPQIFRIVEQADYASIFMEFVEGDTIRLQTIGDPEVFATELIEALLIVAGHPGELTETRFTMTRLLAHATEVAGDPETPQQARDELLTMLASTPARLLRIVERLPKIPSHNDVFFENFFRVTDAYGVRRLRLIDWGTCSRNVVGAEFHHFVSASQEKPELKTVTNIMMRRYSAGLQAAGLDVTPAMIRAGAACYAWVRSISRLKRHNETLSVERAWRLSEMIDRLEL